MQKRHGLPFPIKFFSLMLIFAIVFFCNKQYPRLTMLSPYIHYRVMTSYESPDPKSALDPVAIEVAFRGGMEDSRSSGFVGARFKVQNKVQNERGLMSLSFVAGQV